jgi:uncharacterized protein YdhG (YjbR/CyaY superfamily)
MRSNFKSIDEYIDTFPNDVQKILQKVRSTIKKTVPKETTEAISYQIPTFKYNGNLIHFAGYQKHIGLYPGAAAMKIFAPKLKAYKTSKGAVQFQLDEPIPYDLIKKITFFCVQQNAEKKR